MFYHAVQFYVRNKRIYHDISTALYNAEVPSFGRPWFSAMAIGKRWRWRWNVGEPRPKLRWRVAHGLRNIISRRCANGRRTNPSCQSTVNMNFVHQILNPYKSIAYSNQIPQNQSKVDGWSFLWLGYKKWPGQNEPSTWRTRSTSHLEWWFWSARWAGWIHWARDGFYCGRYLNWTQIHSWNQSTCSVPHISLVLSLGCTLLRTIMGKHCRTVSLMSKPATRRFSNALGAQLIGRRIKLLLALVLSSSLSTLKIKTIHHIWNV